MIKRIIKNWYQLFFISIIFYYYPEKSYAGGLEGIIDDIVIFLLKLIGLSGLLGFLAYTHWTKMTLGSVLTAIGAFFPDTKKKSAETGEGEIKTTTISILFRGGLRFGLIIGGLVLIVGSIFDGHADYSVIKNYPPQLKDSVENYLSLSKDEGVIGITYSRPNASKGLLLITDIFPDSPADKAGLKVGEFIETIDGKSISQLSFDDIKDKMKGHSSQSIEFELSNGNGIKRKVIVIRLHPKKFLSGST